MSHKYKIKDNDQGYFLTLTVTEWIDVFTRKNHKMKIIESLGFCQKVKGLELFGYCLMPSHLHLIARGSRDNLLSSIIHDFKSYTAKAILQQIIEEPESRRKWMLDQFQFAGKYLNRIDKYKFWQDGYHAEIIFSPEVFYQKLNYIHFNPVKDLIVEKPEEYLFSSARNYAGLRSYLNVILETPQLITY
ncbi:MAG: transposase [Bacteroidetes bacterium]|nr:transposase [Bacteroidota bacterium]